MSRRCAENGCVRVGLLFARPPPQAHNRHPKRELLCFGVPRILRGRFSELEWLGSLFCKWLHGQFQRGSSEQENTSRNHEVNYFRNCWGIGSFTFHER